jgi:hypothetical protein
VIARAMFWAACFAAGCACSGLLYDGGPLVEVLLDVRGRVVGLRLVKGGAK